jgi:xylan 1,4-beta-xylosidase
MTGPRTMIVNGGIKFSDKPIWTEGPHIFKRDGYYYLIAAEGGTAGNRSQTVFRSHTITGPYAPGPVNPILPQRDLDPERPFPVYATGHADFVQIRDGSWWAMFLGTRPYEANLSNMGRKTFLLPVTWPKGGWPMILSKGKVVPQAVRNPDLPMMPPNVSFWRDDFSNPALLREWLMLRTPKDRWYKVAPGALTLTARPVSLSSTGNPSFLGWRQANSDATVVTEMRYTSSKTGDHAGLAVFADEPHHYFFGLWQTATGPMIVVALRNGKENPKNGKIIAPAPYAPSTDSPITLRIRTHGGLLDFTYAVSNKPERTMLDDADGLMLASEWSNQFTGVVIGVFAGR